MKPLSDLQTDIIAAMKAKDATTVGALRLLSSSLKNKRIDLGHELSDEEMVAVLAKEVKQRRDSITQYTAADRNDLAEEEMAELAVLSRYLPTQLNDVEITDAVATAIIDTGANGIADMGTVMSALSQYKERADMGRVSAEVRKQLSSQ